MKSYSVYTGIECSSFESEVQGSTLSSILETCRGVIEYTFPMSNKGLVINIHADVEPDFQYLKEQLEAEFDNNSFEVLERDSVNVHSKGRPLFL